MIQRIKDLSRVVAEVDALKGHVRKTAEESRALKEEISLVRSEIGELKELLTQQNGLIDGLESGNMRQHKLCEGLDQELFEFKRMRGSLQKKIVEEFDEVLRSELQRYFDGIKADAREFTQLRGEVCALVSRVSKTSEAIDKFNAIAQQIKAKDFTLERYAKTLEQRDKEKLDLMKRIDTLERMVSKMRRTQKFK
ncbi:MAG: hypothetical protein ACQESG_03205 [Nanobdellota archaeon]